MYFLPFKCIQLLHLIYYTSASLLHCMNMECTLICVLWAENLPYVYTSVILNLPYSLMSPTLNLPCSYMSI
ncbi:hypothetical protein M758_2G196400 [Ceratodon purpureus]|nr:hypothetical protein M758_2G196400 [Ceratodon purpureus]